MSDNSKKIINQNPKAGEGSSSDSTKHTQRKTSQYTPPKIEKLGNLEQLTQSSGSM